MESILERQRQCHEEIEVLEEAITTRLIHDPRTNRDALQLQHEISDYLDLLQVRSRSLKELYLDTDGSRAVELESLIAKTGEADAFDQFYTLFNETQAYHKRNPGQRVESLTETYALKFPELEDYGSVETDPIARMFTTSEAYGKYFELNTLYDRFMNLKKQRIIGASYTRYLDTFDDFSSESFPEAVKQDPNYLEYLRELKDYVYGFWKRVKPLDVHEVFVRELELKFEVSSLETLSTNAGTGAQKEGIWCEICQKLYSKQSVFDGHLNSKKHKAGQAKTLQSSNSNDTSSTLPNARPKTDTKREILWHEHLITNLISQVPVLQQAKKDTKVNIIRKQTLTDKEWQQESLTAAMPTPLTNTVNELTGQAVVSIDNGEEGDEESGGAIYNPLKLPLGWDGKPIPFWLWRLHGLGVEYPCEICGNHIYYGRKSFDRHFSGATHQHGLKCLGITRDFGLYDQIVAIADAEVLRERVEGRRKEKEREEGERIEMEDDRGNVMSERVYKDLVAQGIL